LMLADSAASNGKCARGDSTQYQSGSYKKGCLKIVIITSFTEENIVNRPKIKFQTPSMI